MVFSVYVADQTLAGVLQPGTYLHTPVISIFLSCVPVGQFFFCDRKLCFPSPIFLVFHQLDQFVVRLLDIGLFLYCVGGGPGIPAFCRAADYGKNALHTCLEFCGSHFGDLVPARSDRQLSEE